MIIGLTGPRFAGKTEVAKMLRGRYSFISLSFGDEVRLERDARGLSADYDLHKLGVDLRHEFGSGYWGIRVAGRIVGEAERRNYAVEGIRTAGDVEVFRIFPDFTLVGVTAPLPLRWKRQKIRPQRPDDSKTYEEFVERCARDESSREGGLESGATFDMADYRIDNNSSMDDLMSKLYYAVLFCKNKIQR